MRLGLVGSVLLGAALGSSRGLFAQHAPLAPLPQLPAYTTPASSLYVAADQSGVRFRPVELRFARRQTYQFTRPRRVKALYLHAAGGRCGGAGVAGGVGVGCRRGRSIHSRPRAGGRPFSVTGWPFWGGGRKPPTR